MVDAGTAPLPRAIASCMAASALEGPSPVNRAKRAARTSAYKWYNVMPSTNVGRTISAAVDVLFGGAATDGVVEESLVDHARNWVPLAILTRASRFAYTKTAATTTIVIAWSTTRHRKSKSQQIPDSSLRWRTRPALRYLPLQRFRDILCLKSANKTHLHSFSTLSNQT